MFKHDLQITAFVFVLAAVFAIANPVFPQTTVVVYPGDMGTWAWLEEVAVGSGEMMVGPGAPPSGLGSARLVVDDTGRMILGTVDYAGTPFSSITDLTYSTYRTAPVTGIFANTLQFNVDYDLTDADESWQGRLLFEPYYTGTPVTAAIWQTWDTLTAAAAWWASGSPGNATCSQPSPCTWAEVLAAFPNAGIHATLPGVLLKAGGGWPGGFDGNVDDLTIGISGVTTTYDFEMDVPVELQSFSVE